jgi:pre-mRNA-splicing factor SYF1
VRGALKRFTDDVGKLWTSLADYFIRLGHFEKARDIFEEGISTVITVKTYLCTYLKQAIHLSCHSVL